MEPLVGRKQGLERLSPFERQVLPAREQGVLLSLEEAAVFARVHPTAAAAGRFFERRTRVMTRAFGSPKTPCTVGCDENRGRRMRPTAAAFASPEWPSKHDAKSEHLTTGLKRNKHAVSIRVASHP